MNALSVEILDDLYYLGVNDRETSLFENMWPLPQGISYNAYLIKDKKNALLDTIKITKVDGFMDRLNEILDGGKLDYLVIHHMEPDHSGCIRTVMETYPDVVLVTNKKAVGMLKDYLQIETEKLIVVGEGDVLDLGNRKLNFVMTPMVHWPESMVSYESTDKILFSQDIFGGFGASNGTIFDDEMNIDFIRDETRRYYSNIVGKYSKMALKSLKKAATLDIKTICPVHGLVWRHNPQRIIDAYTRWASQQTEEGLVIVYGSMYGNTEQMADQLARFVAEEGVKNIKVYDVSKMHESYILSDIWKYKGLVLGSCTYHNSVYPKIYNLLHVLDMNKLENHCLGIFGSYGWGGGAVKEMNAFADKNKFDKIETVVDVKGSMTADDIAGLKQMAKEIAEKIKQK